MIGRWPLLLFAGLVLASLVTVAALGRSLFQDVRALATAQNDDVSWRMSQLEVELLRFKSAAQAAQTGDETLAVVRKRFDIFYSRITTLRQSAFYKSWPEQAATHALVQEVTAFLEETAQIIDAADPVLSAQLAEVSSTASDILPATRALALSGIEVFAEQQAQKRAVFSATVRHSAVGLGVLICLLFVAVGVLVVLFRQGQRFALASENTRARYQAAVASSLDAVLVVDTEGRIVEFNGAAETVFGYERAEALGADMAELIIPESMRQAHRDGMQRFLRTGVAKVAGQGRIRLEGQRKSGEVFPVELSISKSEASGEQVFVSFLRDITSELQAEDELREALSKAQEGERAKSDLLTVMSHEMRTPLNGILGALELLGQDGFSDRQKQHLTSIAVSGEVLLSHVNDVLELSSLTAGGEARQSAVFDLKALVDSTAESLRGHAKARGNSLSVDFLTKDLSDVSGDQVALQRCLINLIGNAIKFTQDGAVMVEVERLSQGAFVELRVTDTGSGIAAENLERIFEEFVTVDTAYDRKSAGTGLGLAITKGLVDSMQGEIDVVSELDEGSMFTLRLPLPVARRGHVGSGQRQSGSLPALPDGFRCLVVDDNAINRDVLGAIVDELGGQVVTANGGLEAVARAQEQSFDVLLLDISMPDIDGMETLRRIREGATDTANALAIAVTAHAAQKDHDRILQADFASVLVKPLNRAAVHQALAVLWDLMEPEMGGGEDVSDVPEFLQRFGAERYHAALEETRVEVTSLLNDIAGVERLTDQMRDEAHRLSGSAAILGHQDLWAALQQVQNAEDDAWLASRAALIEGVQRQLDTAAAA